MNQFNNREEVEEMAMACAWAQFQSRANACIYVTHEGKVLSVEYDAKTQNVKRVGNVTVNPDWLSKK